tara:strand:- start:3856 stop:4632 length:777 start_codon:yes stop_codon:yes gene_type:complete
MDLENIYSQYLNNESREYKETNYQPGRFSASSAGSCLKKQWYRYHNIEESNVPKKQDMRKMRLGTLVHKDFENAVKFYIDRIYRGDYNIKTEHEVNLEEYPITGHIDVAMVHKSENKAWIWDYKTAAAFSWKKTFGRHSNEFHHINYGLQVATYAMGLCDTESTIKSYFDIEMGLIWYKKDDSSMREQTIPENFLFEAHNYWDDTLRFVTEIKDETEIKAKVNEGIPFKSWECNYCNWKTICHEQIKGTKIKEKEYAS